MERIALLVLLGMLGNQGCTYIRIAPPDVNPSTQEEMRTVQGLGGALFSPNVAPTNCAGNGLAAVTVRGNVVYSLISIVSLGFWTPTEVSWTCAKDRVVP